MERLEILTGIFVSGWFGGPGAISNRGSFVANNAVNELETNTSDTFFSFVLSNPAGLYRVWPKDNVVILSLWLTLPYHFVLSRPSARISIVYGDNSGYAGVPEVGSGNGSLWVPVANSEIALGTIVPWRGIGGGSVMSLGFSVHCFVSQVGAPSGLNGVRFYPGLGVKVLHTEPFF